MRNRCSFHGRLLCYVGLALMLCGVYGCSSTTESESKTVAPGTSVAASAKKTPAEEKTSKQTVAGESTDDTEVAATSEKEESATSVEQSTPDGATADPIVADAIEPPPVTLPSPDTERIKKLEGALRPLETIPSSPHSTMSAPGRP